MRTIKFRALLSETNLWVYGDLARGISVDPDGPIYDCIIIDSDKNDFWVVRRETIGQFTGLKDKNGKEIYEGDVIKVQTTVNHHYNDDFFEPPEEIEQELIGQIVYRDDLAGFDVETIEPDLHLKNWCLMEDSIDVVEVIGNIHQDKHMIKWNPDR